MVLEVSHPSSRAEFHRKQVAYGQSWRQFKQIPLVIFERLRELVNEFPRIVKGMRKLWTPFHKQMRTILILNCFIAGLEAVIAIVAAVVIAAISKSADWGYVHIALLIVFELLVLRVLHEVFLPWFRDVYILRNFKLDFMNHVTLTCLHWSTSQKPTELPEHRQPVVREGKEVAFTLTDMILREPAFALRGLILLVFFWFTNPYLAAVGMLGMCIELAVVIYMDNAIYEPNRRAQNTENAVWGRVSQILDDSSMEKRSEETVRILIRQCERDMRHYKEAHIQAGLLKLLYQNLFRDPVSIIVSFGTKVILVYWVVNGTLGVGECFAYVALLERARGPFKIVSDFQQQIMNSRQAFRRLGQLSGVDFGIVAPKHATT